MAPFAAVVWRRTAARSARRYSTALLNGPMSYFTNIGPALQAGAEVYVFDATQLSETV